MVFRPLNGGIPGTNPAIPPGRAGRDKTLAAWLAENRINELRLEETLPGISENSRDTDYGQSRWQVTTRILATEEPSMRRVEVTVARYRDQNPNDEPAPVHTLSAFVGAP